MFPSRCGKKALSAVVGIVAMSLALAGCSEATPTDSEEQVLKFGFMTPLTGPATSFGEDARDGALLAVDVANEAGLVPGVTIELVIEDDKSTPEIAVVALQKLKGEGINFITGTVNSSVAVAVASALSGDPDTLYTITGAQIQAPLDEQSGESIIGLTHTNAMYAESVLPWIRDEAKPTKVAFVGENSDFGVQELEQLEAAWSTGTPEIVMKEVFDRTATDFSSVLSNVRDSGADSLYIAVASSTIAASVATQAEALGLDLNIFISSGIVTETLIEAGGETVEGVTSGDVYHATIDNPENAVFVEAFEAKYGETPGPLHALGYESIMLFVEAMNKAGTTTDMPKISSTLRSGTWATPRGELVFDATGRALTPTMIIRVENGKIVLVDTVQ